MLDEHYKSQCVYILWAMPSITTVKSTTNKKVLLLWSILSSGLLRWLLH